MTIDPAECRRLAELCFDDDVGIPATSAVTRIVDHLPQVASALTDAAELVGRCAKLEDHHVGALSAVATLTADRDAARAEIERLRAVASMALVVRNLRLSIDSRLTRQERRVFDSLAEAVDAYKFPGAPAPTPGADVP